MIIDFIFTFDNQEVIAEKTGANFDYFETLLFSISNNGKKRGFLELETDDLIILVRLIDAFEAEFIYLRRNGLDSMNLGEIKALFLSHI
jgi:hypothetical protein